MATTTEVRVDVGALAAALRGEVSDRLATTLIAGFENCAQDGRELTWGRFRVHERGVHSAAALAAY